MMRFVTEAGELLLPAANISLEMVNPYFENDRIPGITTYPFDVPLVGDNPRLIRFPHLYRGAGAPPPVPVYCYLDGIPWKQGSLVFRSYDAPKQVCRMNFVADATDLAKQLDGLRLPALTLPALVFSRTSTATADYVLAPVRNFLFFDEKNPRFAGVLNYQNPSTGVLAPSSAAQVYVPMLYLVPILRQVVAAFGYTITGSWIADPEIQQLVIYSDRALPLTQAVGGTFDPARHLPNLSVPELLLALQKMFCLGLHFQPASQELRITPLREVVARTGYVARPGAVLTTASTNDLAGFQLQLAPDTEDGLDKSLDVRWQALRIGAGQEEITTAAGTLHLVREEDPNVPTRRWLLPAIAAKGASTEYDLGDDSRTGLRLLFDRGLRPASDGHLYRLLSPGTVDYAGTTVGRYSLHWDGPQGLYARWHQPWLDFRTRAVPRTYQVPFTIADLLLLDPATHELVDYHLLLWQKVSLSISASSRLQSATFAYQELL